MRYDYIISGAGCAGLSLLMRMLASGKFSDKKILVADRDLKARNPAYSSRSYSGNGRNSISLEKTMRIFST